MDARVFCWNTAEVAKISILNDRRVKQNHLFLLLLSLSLDLWYERFLTWITYVKNIISKYQGLLEWFITKLRFVATAGYMDVLGYFSLWVLPLILLKICYFHSSLILVAAKDGKVANWSNLPSLVWSNWEILNVAKICLFLEFDTYLLAWSISIWHQIWLMSKSYFFLNPLVCLTSRSAFCYWVN